MFGNLLVATLLMTSTGTTVVVGFYDAAPADPAHALARVEAARILAAAGLAVHWIALDAPLPRAAALRRRVIEVRLLDAGAADEPPSPANVLGSTVRFGTMPHHVVLYDDRARRLAGPGPAQRARVLGRVLAHELVHVLAGPDAHTRRGLMQATWDAASLDDDRAEATALPHALVARVRTGAAERAAAGF